MIRIMQSGAASMGEDGNYFSDLPRKLAKITSTGESRSTNIEVILSLTAIAGVSLLSSCAPGWSWA